MTGPGGGGEGAEADVFDPFQVPALADYLARVRDWHGYIRFLGLPHLRDNPDVGIDRLFVPPHLSAQPISPDTDPANWPKTEPALQRIAQYPRLVVLGDPGSGKSTLVNWLAWNLARPGGNEVKSRLGALVPVVMVLRDLKIGRGITWEGLIAAFLEREMAAPLRANPALEETLKRGEALILLDGIDEIGNVETRQDLRQAVHDGMDRFPKCRWLLTSRVVGYEQVPFHRLEDMEGPGLEAVRPSGRGVRERVPRPETSGLERKYRWIALSRAELAHVAPFTDDQIDAFAANWYALRETVAGEARRKAENLTEAIRRDPGIVRLARVPNLLTMMALIHRVRARLPHGRALLYGEIAEAYLQSIDEFRGLREVDYPLAQKKRWLARVGYEMQRRPAAPAEGEDEEKKEGEQGQREMLAAADDVRGWIAAAMDESGRGADVSEAHAFLDYIGRRSGLLLPRGADQYAFMHLSFQEYFAACFLEAEITSPRWLTRGQGPAGVSREDLRRFADGAPWREPLIFLAELLAEKPDWPQALAETLFGEDFKDIRPGGERSMAAVALAVTLALNPHSGFDPKTRERALDAACAREVAAQQEADERDEPFWEYRSPVLTSLFGGESEDAAPLLGKIAAAAATAGLTALSLNGCSAIHDLTPLSRLSALQGLDLSGTGVRDLSPLSGLTALRVLDLSGTQVSDLKPLSRLTALQGLFLSGTQVSDLQPLSRLTALLYLDLAGTQVSDLQPLSRLTALQDLDLSGTGVRDLQPLSRLTALQGLGLSDTGVSDLQPLAGLTALHELDLRGTLVSPAEVARLKRALPDLPVIGP
jgi:internalin A